MTLNRWKEYWWMILEFFNRWSEKCLKVIGGDINPEINQKSVYSTRIQYCPYRLDFKTYQILHCVKESYSTSNCKKLTRINCPIDSWIFQVQSIPFRYTWGYPGDVITPKGCVMVTAHSESWITYMQTCVIWKYHWKNFHLEIMLIDFPYSLLSGYRWIIEKNFCNFVYQISWGNFLLRL